MRQFCVALVAAGVAITLASSVRVGAQLKDAPLPHFEGQGVTPSFEGWFENSDGTYSLSFGYLNRNRKETPDIPVGPNNKIEPGPADQGQPTHFLPRRQTGIFTVVVPKEFANNKTNKLTWTITIHGETNSIPGHLRPEWHIDALKEVTSGNTPPVVKFDPVGKTGQGPSGTKSPIALNVPFPGPATLDVWVTDDMVRKRPQGDGATRDDIDAAAASAARGVAPNPDGTPGAPAAPAGRAGAGGRAGGGGRGRAAAPPLGVVWSQYRGPGTVTFKETSPKIDGGKATTTATFSEPGTYTLRVLAFDTSGQQAAIMAGGFQCCWTNGYVNVTVGPKNR